MKCSLLLPKSTSCAAQAIGSLSWKTDRHISPQPYIQTLHVVHKAFQCLTMLQTSSHAKWCENEQGARVQGVPGTVRMPVSFSSLRQYHVSGDLPASLAALIAYRAATLQRHTLLPCLMWQLLDPSVGTIARLCRRVQTHQMLSHCMLSRVGVGGGRTLGGRWRRGKEYMAPSV